jgi:hypothetical protein
MSERYQAAPILLYAHEFLPQCFGVWRILGLFVDFFGIFCNCLLSLWFISGVFGEFHPYFGFFQKQVISICSDDNREALEFEH